MAYTDLATQNITTISGLFVYVSQNVPVFIPMLLLTAFAIVFFGSLFAQRRLTGQSNIWASFSVAGYFIAIISVIMSLIPDLVNSYVVLICVAIAIIGTAFLLTQDN